MDKIIPNVDCTTATQDGEVERCPTPMITTGPEFVDFLTVVSERCEQAPKGWAVCGPTGYLDGNKLNDMGDKKLLYGKDEYGRLFIAAKYVYEEKDGTQQEEMVVVFQRFRGALSGPWVRAHGDHLTYQRKAGFVALLQEEEFRMLAHLIRYGIYHTERQVRAGAQPTPITYRYF